MQGKESWKTRFRSVQLEVAHYLGNQDRYGSKATLGPAKGGGGCHPNRSGSRSRCRSDD